MKILEDYYREAVELMLAQIDGQVALLFDQPEPYYVVLRPTFKKASYVFDMYGKLAKWHTYKDVHETIVDSCDIKVKYVVDETEPPTIREIKP